MRYLLLGLLFVVPPPSGIDWNVELAKPSTKLALNEYIMEHCKVITYQVDLPDGKSKVEGSFYCF